jgi:iron complex outermembrane receptor protein
MSFGRPRVRAAAPWQLGSALAMLALAPATVLAQAPPPEPPPAAPDDSVLMPEAPPDTAWSPAPTWTPAPPPPPAPLWAQPPPPPPAPAWTPAPAPALPPAPSATVGVELGPVRTSFGSSPSDAHSAVPVTVIDRAMLESTGSASLSQALQQLSFQSNAINNQFNNGGDGSTRIALRGLAANRTLVLINGRRHVHGSTGADASVDLEAIPLAVVERVEIVRGAAAIHGLGGMAGVVNIVTRQDADGVEAAAFAGGTPESQGQSYDANVTLGQRFERGRITATAGYHEQRSILSADREFARTDLFYDFSTGEVTKLGSTAVPEGYIRDYGEAPGNEDWQALVAQYPGQTTFFNDPNTGWRPFQTTGNSDTGEGDFYNYAPENYLVTPLERYHVFASGDYQLGDQLRAFAEASYVKLRTEQQLAPDPLFTLSEGVTVSADNIYNPFGRDFIDMRRRVVEAGNRRSQQDTDTMRLVVGLDGALPFDVGTPGTWRWEASYGYGATDSTQTSDGVLRRDRLAGALGPSFIDAEGRARCGTSGDPIDGCVPLNLFGGPGTITPDMLAYLGHTRVDQGQNEQHRIAVEVGGELMRLPSGGHVSLSVGADYREESGVVETDLEGSTGTVPGFEGSYEVSGAHALLTAIPWVDQAAGRSLELQGAVSTFDLSTSGTGTTWHVAGLARLGAGLGVRASQGRGMGAPSLAALFSPATDGFPAVSDPCSTAFGPRSPNAEINCSADGIPADVADDRAQLRAQTGGNPELRPEIADVRSAGVVFAPDSMPGLALSADYFQVVVEDEINSLGAAYILDSCYNSAPGARSNCDRVVRDVSGFIDSIVDTLSNRGSRETAGVDVQLSHDDATSVGRLRYRIGGTWLQKFDVVSPDGVTRSGKGFYDLGVYPEYRFDGSVLWDNGKLGAGAHVRYVGGFTECENNDCQSLDGDNPDGIVALSREVESYLTGDVLGSLTLDSSLGRTVLTVGVRNVLDRQPPVIYNGFTASSDAATYDFAGRFTYLRLTQQF